MLLVSSHERAVGQDRRRGYDAIRRAQSVAPPKVCRQSGYGRIKRHDDQGGEKRVEEKPTSSRPPRAEYLPTSAQPDPLGGGCNVRSDACDAWRK